MLERVPARVVLDPATALWRAAAVALAETPARERAGLLE
jgi:hypothetical protein